MKTVYKYPVVPGRFRVEMPKDAQVLSIAVQEGRAFIWALVETTKAMEARDFRAVATGEQLPMHEWMRFIGTIQFDHMTLDGSGKTKVLVFHVFEVTE